MLMHIILSNMPLKEDMGEGETALGNLITLMTRSVFPSILHSFHFVFVASVNDVILTILFGLISSSGI